MIFMLKPLEYGFPVLGEWARRFPARRICMPLAAGASLFIGLFVGMEIQERRDSEVPTSASVQSSEQQVSVHASKVETAKKVGGTSIVAPHARPRLSQK